MALAARASAVWSSDWMLLVLARTPCLTPSSPRYVPHGHAAMIDVHRRVHGEQAHLAVPAEHQRADVAGVELVGLEHLEGGVVELLDRVRHRHVVELRGPLDPLEVLRETEHGDAALRLVGADALEDPRAVVQRVREHVDLGVGPGDQLAVHPDRVHLGDRGHRLPPQVLVTPAARAARIASVISVGGQGLLAGRRDVGGARAVLQGRLDGPLYGARRVPQPEAQVEHHRRAQDGRARVGEPLAGDVRRRAVDGLVEAHAAGADARARQHADAAGEHAGLVAEHVAEQVLGGDHVELLGLADELHGAVVHEHVAHLDVRVALRDADGDGAPQARALEHVGLVDRVHEARGGPAASLKA